MHEGRSFLSLKRGPKMNKEDRMRHDVIEMLKETGRQLLAAKNADSETLCRLILKTAETVAGVIDLREPGKEGHHRRVANLARTIGKELHLKSDWIDGVGVAALFHDVGKILLPAEMLGKPTRLTMAEMAQVKTHAR